MACDCRKGIVSARCVAFKECWWFFSWGKKASVSLLQHWWSTLPHLLQPTSTGQALFLLAARWIYSLLRKHSIPISPPKTPWGAPFPRSSPLLWGWTLISDLHPSVTPRSHCHTLSPWEKQSYSFSCCRTADVSGTVRNILCITQLHSSTIPQWCWISAFFVILVAWKVLNVILWHF